MKKIASIMLGLSLLVGATAVFASPKDDTTTTKKKKKTKKKNTNTTVTTKG